MRGLVLPACLLFMLVIFSGPAAPTHAQEAAEPDRPERQERQDRRRDRGDMLQRLLQNDPANNLINVISRLNMTPEFTLTAEQKTEIQSIREAYREKVEAFVDESREKLDFIRMQAEEARASRDQNALRAAWQDAQELMAQGPSGKQLNEDIKEVLTDGQREKVDAALAEQAERWQRWREERERRRQEREAEEPTI